MTETIHVPCQRCGDEIAFQVEGWAAPPERAFCDEDCYREHHENPTSSPAAPARA